MIRAAFYTVHAYKTQRASHAGDNASTNTSRRDGPARRPKDTGQARGREEADVLKGVMSSSTLLGYA